MVAARTFATFVVAALASLFMTWTIGAGSSGSTPFAPAVGANAISVMHAGFIIGLLDLAGVFLQGANVISAVGMELIGGVTLAAGAAVVALLTAAMFVTIDVFAGYPIATAFTATGTVIGVGLAMGGDPAWSKYQQIVSLWVLTPLVGDDALYATVRLLRADGVSERWIVPALAGLVGLLVANMGFAGLGDVSGSASVARTTAAELTGLGDLSEAGWLVAVSLLVAFAAAAVIGRWATADKARDQRHLLLILDGLVASSAGGSQVGLAIGPLVPLLDVAAVPPPALLVGGGLGLLAESWTDASRMIKALAQDYSPLGPWRFIAAMIPSFAIAQTAVALGVPISFSEIIVSTIIGSGYAAGGSGVSGRRMLYTVLAWIGSLVLALGLGYGVFTLALSVLGV